VTAARGRRGVRAIATVGLACSVLLGTAASPARAQAPAPAQTPDEHQDQPTGPGPELLVRAFGPHGRKITVVLREKGQSERAEAIRLICGLSEPDFEQHVLFQTFRGTVNRAPRSIQSASAMLRFIFNTPGAIGYVRADEVDETVKVVQINGRLPGEARYPLRRAARIGKVSWPAW
jgi:hypothetical protein